MLPGFEGVRRREIGGQKVGGVGGQREGCQKCTPKWCGSKVQIWQGKERAGGGNRRHGVQLLLHSAFHEKTKN